MNKNPIYIEWGVHQQEECYKIDLPFTTYNKSTIILCPVSDGLRLATELATNALNDHMKDAFKDKNIKTR